VLSPGAGFDQLVRAMGAGAPPRFFAFQQATPATEVPQRVVSTGNVNTSAQTAELFAKLLVALLTGLQPQPPVPKPSPRPVTPTPGPVIPVPNTWTPPAVPVGTPSVLPATSVPQQVTFMSNPRLRVGLDARRGGAIVHLSSFVMPSAWSGKNVLNDFDLGRLIQQSYYGCEDASCWHTRPWKWNPVQAGSWQNRPAGLVQFQALGAPAARVFARTVPRNWGGQQLLPDVLLDTDAQLMADHVALTFTMRYTGTAPHPIMTQEIPAFFADRRLGALVFYDGTAPWTDDTLDFVFPGGTNAYYTPTEKWAAYVDPGSGFGVGIFVPVASGLTAYRVGPDGSNATSDCSYFAMTTRFAIQPGAVFSYTAYLTLGRLDEMRGIFQRINREIVAAGGIGRNAINTKLVLGGGSIVPLAVTSNTTGGGAAGSPTFQQQQPSGGAPKPPSSSGVVFLSTPDKPPSAATSPRPPPPSSSPPRAPSPPPGPARPGNTNQDNVALQLLKFAGEVIVGLARNAANATRTPSSPRPPPPSSPRPPAGAATPTRASPAPKAPAASPRPKVPSPSPARAPAVASPRPSSPKAPAPAAKAPAPAAKAPVPAAKAPVPAAKAPAPAAKAPVPAAKAPVPAARVPPPSRPAAVALPAPPKAPAAKPAGSRSG
jgi:hypothetical protein